MYRFSNLMLQAENPKAEEKPTASPGTQAYSMEEVAKHNKKDDIWVIVDGQVLDVTEV